jgi:peptidoglycan/LPS O-acetylase OafA/YrhL
MIIWGLGTAAFGAYFESHPDETFLVSRPILNVVLFVIYGDQSKFLEDFAVGMLIAVGYAYVMNSPRKVLYLLKAQRILLWLLIVCVVLFVYEVLPDSALPFIPIVYQDTAWVNEFVFALCYGYVVAFVLFNHPDQWLVRLFSWTPLRWLGLISFSLYIWHRPLIQILAANLGPSLRRLNPVLKISLFWMVTFTVSVVFCYFLYILIEKPGMRLSEKLRQQLKRQEGQQQAVTELVYSRSQRELDSSKR